MVETFIFILVVIFVAYVIYSHEDSSEQDSSKKEEDLAPVESPDNKPAAVNVNVEVAIQSSPKKVKPVEPVKAKTKPKVKPKPKAKTEPKKQAAPKVELRTVMMKNPATGEEAKVAGNYRMVKRWIKDALVEEGLLDKVYKINELDDAAKPVVAEALSIIKAMDKYKA